MMLALPLRLEGDGHYIVDATGMPIALLSLPVEKADYDYRRHGAEIVAAVNSHAKLLIMAKISLTFMSGHAKTELQAAIAAAEEPVP
jgi:hypothetical protein